MIRPVCVCLDVRNTSLFQLLVKHRTTTRAVARYSGQNGASWNSLLVKQKDA